MGLKFFHYDLMNRAKVPLQNVKHVPWKYSRYWECSPNKSIRQDFMEGATEVDSKKELDLNMENTTGRRREEIRT